MYTTPKHIFLRSLLLAAYILALVIQPFSARPVFAAPSPQTINYQPTLTATPASGPAPLTVNFSRYVATDPNGPLVSYVMLDFGAGPGLGAEIDFGDGTSTFILDKTSSMVYNLPGTYTAVMTVFYNNSTSITTTLIITVDPSVTPEQLPLIVASPASGTAPLVVNLTSSATMNPNGPLINNYKVDYGDGTSDLYFFLDGAPSFINNGSHTYNTPGTYTATLTVTYNNATSASTTTTIIVNPVLSNVVRSTAVNLSATLKKTTVNVSGTVIVQNENGTVIPGAIVSITWVKPNGRVVTQNAKTNANGVAKFSTSGNRGTYTLTVTNIRKTGYSFDSINSVVSGSITK